METEKNIEELKTKIEKLVIELEEEATTSATFFWIFVDAMSEKFQYDFGTEIIHRFNLKNIENKEREERYKKHAQEETLQTS